MANVTVTNLTTSPISCDVGLVQPGTPLTVAMGPRQLDLSAANLKLLTDLGRVSVTISNEVGKLDVMEAAPQAMLLQQADVVIPTAAVLTLNATPVTLVAAPGAGFANVLHSAMLYMKYNSIIYTIAAGKDLSIKYTNGSGLEVAQIETTGLLDTAADALRYVRAHTQLTGDTSTVPVANAALVLQMLTGEVTAGNSDLKMRVWFHTIPTTL